MTTKVDIANRGLQHIGGLRITSFTDGSRSASEINAAWDNIRRACLRVAPWKFAARRIALRNITSTTKSITFATWAVGTTYVLGDIIVGSDGILYRSVVASNVGNDPTLDLTGTNWVQYFGPTTADTFSTSVSYFAGELAISSGTLYVSIANANKNNTPPDATHWSAISGSPTQSSILLTDATGYTGVSGGTVKNYYRLPYGFMRLAWQDPKSAANQVQATSGGIRYSDWEYSGPYLLSATAAPLLVNCIVDWPLVNDWDPTFREFVSARVGLEMVEILTQDPTKMQLVGTIYQRYRDEARSINNIEVGSTEEMDEDYRPEFQIVGPTPDAQVVQAAKGAAAR